MNNRKRMIASGCWIVIGTALITAGYAGWIDDYWHGMGTALLIVGVLQMLRWIRYHKDQGYREKMDVEAKDERNRFISSKAWAWAGYLYVLIGAAGSIAFKLAGNDLMTKAAAMSVCLVMVFYWLCYAVLCRKY